MADVLRAGVELAVGKRTRAALAELDVRALVQLARCPEALDIAPSPLDAFAALEQDRPPQRASTSAANSPAGPAPITTGRTAGGAIIGGSS